MTKKIAIIGASYLQLPLVQKAKEMGIETHCFAWTDGAVCKEFADYFYPISILEKEKILDICKDINIDGITSIASDAAVPTCCFIAENMNLITNSYKSSFITTNKYEMRKVFLKKNIPSPKFAVGEDSSVSDYFKFPIIVKPTDRSGSRGVTKVKEKRDLRKAIERAKEESFTKKAIVEEFIAGNEVSVESISWEGKHYILAVTDKVTTGEPYFVELEHHQPSQINMETQEVIKYETINALNALDIKFGASHTEILVTNNGKIYLIETGARMGGDFIGSDLVKLSTGYDFINGVIDIALGNFIEPCIEKKGFSGVYFLSKETEQIRKIIDNKDSYPEIVKAEITDDELHNIQQSSDRSGYFIYQGEKKLLLIK